MSQAQARMIVSWVLQIIVAIILLQTLFFKFSAARESVYIFSRLGLEPWGRIGSGIFELMAAILLLVPRTVTLGAVMAMGVIGGAIISHLIKLGITLPAVDDHGELFGLAVAVFVGSAIILFLRRRELPMFGHIFHRGPQRY